MSMRTDAVNTTVQFSNETAATRPNNRQSDLHPDVLIYFLKKATACTRHESVTLMCKKPLDPLGLLFLFFVSLDRHKKGIN